MRRRDYWLYSLPVLFVTMPLMMYGGQGNALVNALAFVVLGFVMWASVALNVKRLQDRNRSPWLILITFVPIVGPIFVIVELGILDGTPGPNRFGPDPKGRGEPGEGSKPSQVKPEKDKDTVTIEM